jgi:hypothetical protein
MGPACDNLRRFVGRLHRRLLLIRTIESGGVGLLIGSAAGLLLIPILLYRGQPAVPLTLGILALGVFCGLLWSLLRRPRRLDAAVEADRQLGLADLLSTAWLVKEGPADCSSGFSAAVLISAEARCATLSATCVILNRLGARSWTGVGLATALVLTLGLISANPLGSGASPPQREALLKSTATRPGQNNHGHRPGASFPANTSSAIAADHPSAGDNPLDPTRTTTPVQSKDVGNADSANSGADPTGSGAGSGRSNSSNPKDSIGASGTEAARTGADPASGGAGSPAGIGSGQRGASGASVGEAGSGRVIAPWAAASWAAGQAAADSALRGGRIPPAYHDLVRDYFKRD